MMSSQEDMKHKDQGLHLNDRQRLEIIALLNQSKPQSM